MHKHLFLFVLLWLVFLVAGCNASQAAVTATPSVTHTIVFTKSPTSLPVLTETPIPTQTPTTIVSPSPSPSPTPQPSATPNFNPPAKTLTPSAKAVCPVVNSEAKIGLGTDYSSIGIDLLGFLNAGGNWHSLQRVFQAEGAKQKPDYLGKIQAIDVTDDEVPEIIVWFAEYVGDIPGIPVLRYVFPGHVQASRVHVFTCNEGAYLTLATLKDEYYDDIAMPSIVDLNADGVPEIIQTIYDFAGSGYGLRLSILEWNGSEFVSLIDNELDADFLSSFSESEIDSGVASVANGSFKLEDTDRNGTTEVVVLSDWFRGQNCALLYRETRMVLMWDGRGFSGFYQRSPAQYRIQAIWDGDEASRLGRLDDALAFYTDALTDDALLPWSPEYRNLQLPLCNVEGSGPIPSNPVIDRKEKPRLEGYALYRIMVIHAVRRDMAEVGAIYNSLRESYQSGNADASYFELATAFWNEYSIDQNVSRACESAIAYAKDHPGEVLAPLDQETYGDYTSFYIYLPERTCPFK